MGFFANIIRDSRGISADPARKHGVDNADPTAAPPAPAMAADAPVSYSNPAPSLPTRPRPLSDSNSVTPKTVPVRPPVAIVAVGAPPPAPESVPPPQAEHPRQTNRAPAPGDPNTNGVDAEPILPVPTKPRRAHPVSDPEVAESPVTEVSPRDKQRHADAQAADTLLPTTASPMPVATAAESETPVASIGATRTAPPPETRHTPPAQPVESRPASPALRPESKSAETLPATAAADRVVDIAPQRVDANDATIAGQRQERPPPVAKRVVEKFAAGSVVTEQGPRVFIGRVDIVVEAAPPPPRAAPRRESNLASRQYLKRL